MPKKAKISNFELKNCYIPQKKAESMYNKDSTRKSNISYKKNKKKIYFFGKKYDFYYLNLCYLCSQLSFEV